MKNNINELLKNADDDTLNTLAERYPAAGNKEREKIYSMIIKKSGSLDSFQHADIVHGVDIYHRPKWRRTAAVAASLAAAVFGITGTFYTLSQFSAPNESVSSEYHSSEETTKAATPEADTTTKEGVYQKMFNSFYCYDKVSGEMVLSTENSTESLVVDFEADLEKSVSYSNSKKIKIIFDNDKYIRENEEFTYCDGNQIYKVDAINKITDMNGFAAKRSEMTAANDTPSRYADVTNLPYVSAALIPRLSVLDLIDNSENWEISGTETYLDRKCTTISGEIYGEFGAENNIRSYCLCVDNKTGIVLKYFASNLSGEYQHVMLMRNIAFDDDVEVRDLTEYVRSDSLSSYAPQSRPLDIAAVVGINGNTGFIIADEIFRYDDPEKLVLNVYDTDLKTVIDKFSFGNIEAEGEEIG